MALHNTQCPHCFTTYVISDEQLRVSEGMVRCGTCRERFQARLIDKQTETPRFDPREAFIEPLTEERDTQKKIVEQALAEAEPQEFSFANPHTESEKSISLSDVSESVNSDMSLDIDEDAPTTPVDSKQLSAEKMLANIRAKQQRQLEQKQVQQGTSQTPTEDVAAKPDTKKPLVDNVGQQELPLPVSSSIEQAKTLSSTSPQTENKETLIDQVDSLVDNKLINTADPKIAVGAVAANLETKAEKPFQLDRKPKTKEKQRSWFSLLLILSLMVIGVALCITLVYQLWMKQIVAFKKDSFAQKKIVELSAPVAKQLADYNIILPMRRNLSQLELASARTEAHPARPSTTLLRISIINHAEIEQQLPWLEMTLRDAEGRLVSRRNLSPRDYVYQNATNDLIGARELKKVTIELLSFPKHAAGYELKILNK